MDKEQQSLRSGYLLTQIPYNKWKIRWYTLTEEQLICHPQRRHFLPISYIPLSGCSIICPCSDLPEVCPQFLLKILTPSGEDLYFQAAGEIERDGWAHAIGAVIRSQSSANQLSYNKMEFQKFRAYANVSEIIGAIQDPDAGVKIDGHLRGGEVYKNSFKGSDVIDWFLRWSIVRNRENGTAMAQTLLKLGHIQEVDIHDGSSGVSSKFNDDEKLYRFTSINLGLKRSSFYDSTDDDDDDDESSSSDEDDDAKEELKRVKVKLGKVVRESFLMKKRHMRKVWRVIKTTLREKPPALYYHKASYIEGCENQTRLKSIDLENCLITESIKPATSKGMRSRGKLARYRLSVRDQNGKCITLQTKDEQENTEWLALLQQVRPKLDSSSCGKH